MPGPYRAAARERLPVSTLQCFHIPIRRAGCPHPAATFRCRQHPGRDYNPCLPPWGKVAPQGRMRGRLPLPPIPGQAVGGGVPDAPETLRQRPSPGQSPAEGSRPLPTDRTIDGCSRQPPGRACPAPTVRRPGNGCPRKPHSVSISPIRRAGCPHPAATSRRRQQQPLPSPLGEGGPAGPDEGLASVTTHSRASRRGRRPRRPAKPPVNTHPPGNHPRRGQDPSLRAEPLTGAHANPRAGHARPLPCGGPETGVRVNPAGVSISPSVGRGAPTPPRPSAAANTPGGITTLAFPRGGRWPRRAG